MPFSLSKMKQAATNAIEVTNKALQAVDAVNKIVPNQKLNKLSAIGNRANAVGTNALNVVQAGENVITQAKKINGNTPVIQQIPNGPISTMNAVAVYPASTLPKNAEVLSTTEELKPDEVVCLNVKDLRTLNQVYAGNVHPEQPVNIQVRQIQKGGNIPVILPGQTTAVALDQQQIPSTMNVTTQAKFVNPDAVIGVPVVQTQASALKKNVQVVQQTPGGPLTTLGATNIQPANRLPGSTILTASPQDLESKIKAGQVAQVNPEVPVTASPSDLHQGQAVLVNNQQIKPAERELTVQVSPTQSMARPHQLKSQAQLQVQVQNVQPSVTLVRNADGLLTTKKAQGAAKGQTGGASSAFISSFYSNTVVGGPAEISRITLQGIDNAPMFHPLDYNAVVPTLPSTGIIPEGIVLSNQPSTITPY